MSALQNAMTQLAEDFCITTGELLDENAKYISELRKYKDIDIEEAALNNAAEMIKSMAAEELLDEFIDCHDDWHQVSTVTDPDKSDEENLEMNRNRIMKFITEVVPKTYVNAPFDVELLTISVERYMFHKNKGFFKNENESDENNWPVNYMDIDNMKEYFVCMIEIACKYIFAGRQGPEGPSFKESVPLEKYVKMFDIKLI